MSQRFNSLRITRDVHSWGDNIGVGISLFAFVVALIGVGWVAAAYLK